MIIKRLLCIEHYCSNISNTMQEQLSKEVYSFAHFLEGVKIPVESSATIGKGMRSLYLF